MRIGFDSGPGGRGAIFSRPQRLIEAWQPGGVPLALAAIDAARAEGAWVAGYASYELGYALERRLTPSMPEPRRLPLLRFGVFETEPEPWSPRVGPASLGALVPRWTATEHATALERVRAYIAAGDIYQANLTFPLDAACSGSPEALFAALSRGQRVSHGALVEQEGLPALVSRSPELFFATDGAGRIETRPMKGTRPRGATPEEDAAHRAFLAADEKNRAENLMIVDLLRNDLSRVAVPGSVSVPKLFDIEIYATVHQMVSHVAARLAPGVGLGAILAALFPCGSITGAPKLRAMEIIRELEPWPREAYCGAIGWAAPDGRSSFNVAIRTLMVEAGRATLNVGGGIVWDSDAASEWDEALWKTRFARLPG
ncbi:aminodeoxychorismate synthase subunit I [Limimaricola soesokkakensis]|uniref:Aminodeoxychorismate synthase component 1 n=1 Tax=Limimaricola soesokkakensis TaxID=1343159 RepID=A0A1X6YUR3_9RHOB|nr:aminodeoxychorismate synthase component I [Limimaricola soesokkakensis]PSK87623.1 aminodeoxychorismate synthase subunit I [Limimaricola soesokkakensis]SLN31933.1 Aminodeoxychorismate synthase component 1 [Limimaricola soesokkakensis]